MSLNPFSNQRARSSPPQDAPAEPFANNSLPGRWSGRIFYGFSALLHIAVAVALSGSWIFGPSASKASADTAPPPTPEIPTVARMAIDVGPVKYSEMKIEKLIGRPRSQSTP